MRIVILTNEYAVEGGGLSYSCRQFHQLLSSLEHDVIICSSENDNNIAIHGGYAPHLNEELALELKLKETIKALPPCDLIIAFGGGFNGYYATLLAQKVKSRFWLMLRGSDANLCKWNQENAAYIKYAVERAESVFALSREMAENINLIITTANIFLIPNHAVQHKAYVKPFPKEITIGTGATHLNEKKGVKLLIEMVAAYKKNFAHRPLRLELVGEVDTDILAQYKDIAENLQVEDSITFLGRLSHTGFLEKEKGWDMYIQASVCEGMGNSVVDSMAWGVPIMLSNTGFVAEYARNTFPKILFSSFDPSVMAEELYAILSADKINEDYVLFYHNFFKHVSEKRIKSLWDKHLSSDATVRPKKIPNGILSVSLHDIAGEAHDNITTPVEVFKAFVGKVAANGYRLCSMRKYLEHSQTERQNCIVCTFDDGYKGLVDNAMPILDRFGFTATVFVCSSYIGQRNDWNCKDKTARFHLDVNELKELQRHGWEIGSHGSTHRSLLRLNDDEIITELKTSKNVLESLFGPVKTYAYPYGDYSEYIKKQVGHFYEYAFLLTQGGVFLDVDALQIRRYYISEINQILKVKA